LNIESQNRNFGKFFLSLGKVMDYYMILQLLRGVKGLELQVGSPELEKKWYVVHTYSGYENKVKANLEKRLDSMGMQDKIFRVLVPMEQEFEIKDGKKKVGQKKVFPGYVLVEMVMGDDSWYVVRNTPGVTGFVGPGSKPIPLEPAEVRDIMKRMGLDEPRPKVTFSVGESVRIITGPFENFIGNIEEIVAEKGKARVLVSMFGRETPLVLDFAQLEKV
jgi:transcriptional antiterminator NusG